MSSPWATLPAGQTGVQTAQQSQFAFDPNKPASIPLPSGTQQNNQTISDAAKGFSFGAKPSAPAQPMSNQGSSNGGMGRGQGGARVLFKPPAQPGRSVDDSEDWGASAPPQRSQPPANNTSQGELKIDNWDPALAEALSNTPAQQQHFQVYQQLPHVPNLQQPPQHQLNQQQNPNNQAAQIGGEEELRPDEASLISKALHRKMGLIKTKADLEVIHSDPSSPLHSIKNFQELNLKPELLQGIFGMGFRYPSRIQETALPILLSDNPRHNLIAQSQSGTGKTAAFVLTMLMRVDVNKNYPQALCIAPTHELALQIGAVTEEMGRYMSGLSVGYAVRGSTTGGPGSETGPITSQVIIGTPGTVMDWGLKLRKLDLSRLVVFVLDEADVMIAMQGHRDSSFRIKTKLSPTCQLLLFSATYDDEVFDFAQKMVPNADIIKLKREELSLDNVKQFVVRCVNDEEKYNAICAIYGSTTVGQSMIFCERRNTADWLAGKMSQDGHQVGLLHGGLTVEQRANIIERFREAKERVLITTNVAARGIDIEQVTVVVNYDLPIDMKTRRVDFDTYLHRIGRTGRFGRVGLALNLISNASELEHIRSIENNFGRKIDGLDVSDVEILASKLGGE